MCERVCECAFGATASQHPAKAEKPPKLPRPRGNVAQCACGCCAQDQLWAICQIHAPTYIIVCRRTAGRQLRRDIRAVCVCAAPRTRIRPDSNVARFHAVAYVSWPTSHTNTHIPADDGAKLDTVKCYVCNLQCVTIDLGCVCVSNVCVSNLVSRVCVCACVWGCWGCGPVEHKHSATDNTCGALVSSVCCEHVWQRWPHDDRVVRRRPGGGGDAVSGGRCAEVRLQSGRL